MDNNKTGSASRIKTICGSKGVNQSDMADAYTRNDCADSTQPVT